MPSFSSSSMSNVLNQRTGSRTALYAVLAPLFDKTQLFHCAASLSLSTFATLALLPFLLASILILIPLAFLTTCFAISAIVFRTFLIYLEVFANLFRRENPHFSQLSTAVNSPKTSSERSSPVKVTPPPPLTWQRTIKPSRDTSHVKELDLSRDFESLGGWCYSNSTSIESSPQTPQSLDFPPILDLPASTYTQKHIEERKHKRRHSRSLTSGSLGHLAATLGSGKAGSWSQPDLGTTGPYDGEALMRRPRSLIVSKEIGSSGGRRRSRHGSPDRNTMAMSREVVCA